MRKFVAAAVMALSFIPSCALANERVAGERVGGAAAGALAGAVVLGPIGAVAGAAIGYIAGPSIANSWGRSSSEPQRLEEQSGKARLDSTSQRTPASKQTPSARPRSTPAELVEASSRTSVTAKAGAGSQAGPSASARAPTPERTVEGGRKEASAPAKPAAQTQGDVSQVPH